jgi:GT2 family glycosyltransferase/glycosyltransferase involved in cell wall biosynthesis
LERILAEERREREEAVANYQAALEKSRGEFEEKCVHIERLLKENAELREGGEAARREREEAVANYQAALEKSRGEFEEKCRHVEALLKENNGFKADLADARLRLTARHTRSSALMACFVAAEQRAASTRAKTFFPLLSRVANLLSRTTLFDENYYLHSNPDVAASGMQALRHYLRYGVGEGRDPHPLFDTSWYLERYPDVAASGLNPLFHFLKYGAAEQRDPHPLFDTKLYVSLYPEAGLPGTNPVEHFLEHGAAKGLRPHWLFDTRRYQAEHPEIGGRNPLAHYLQFGAYDDKSPHWAFDPDYYLSQYPELLQSDTNPLVHFVTVGWRLGLNPNPAFNVVAYLAQHPELGGREDNPLVHYVRGHDYAAVVRGCEAPAVPPTSAIAGAQYEEQQPTSGLVEFLDQEWGVEERNRILGLMRQFRLPFTTDKRTSFEPDRETLNTWLAETASLSTAQSSEAPEVSIIIPVFNQVGYTLACIASVLATPTRRSFELIVADDCSTDATESVFGPGLGKVRYVRGTENQGFIRNCNAAAKHARGRYVLFLNNDTLVLPGWLDELIDTLEADGQIGIAGSKLIYPDGRLQEAGGILWQDASAWNFGRFDNPRKPEYCYLRDVDYMSGASIALPRQIWEKLGGFDEWYDVAYGEDSDLALRVWQAGYRVVLQPLSMLIHFEGVSSGTDVTQGVKAYQVSNARKLAERWKESLAGHRPNGQQPEREKERRVTRRALVIDHCTPTPDQDAGSLTCFEIMRALQGNGYKVTFIPEDNFLYMPRETRALQRIGIEAIYWPSYGSVEQYLNIYGDLFDVVLIFRQGAAGRHLAKVRQLCPRARVVFHSSDLHFLREQREAELKGGNPAEFAAAEQTRQRELEIIKGVDCTIVHSSFEKEMLADIAPGANVYVFPWILDLVGCNASFERRSGMAFLGGYRHPPNVDAVLYFVDQVWTRVRRKLPDAEFLVVGSHAPRELSELDGRDGVRVVGFVEDLAPVFESVRLSVAPIRYGAGIKGKVAMSFAYGVPVVATACAAEGMDLEEGREVIVADAPEAMARAIVSLYNDAERWQAMSNAGLEFIRRNYSSQLGLRRVDEILKMAGVVQPAPVAA